MGKFITPLRVEQVSEATGLSNAKWRLTEPFMTIKTCADDDCKDRYERKGIYGK